MRKLLFLKDAPVPNACMTTNLTGVPLDEESSRAMVMAFEAESVIMRGGPMGLEKGLSVARGALRVMMIAEGGVGEVEMAARRSERFRGVPWEVVRPGRAGRVVGLRMRAVNVWPRVRPWSMTSWPVRPLPPRMRKCIVRFLRCFCMMIRDVVG